MTSGKEKVVNEEDYEGFEKIAEDLADFEHELYKAKEARDTLLAEIEEINSSEEKYRSIITKLKNRI